MGAGGPAAPELSGALTNARPRPARLPRRPGSPVRRLSFTTHSPFSTAASQGTSIPSGETTRTSPGTRSKELTTALSVAPGRKEVGPCQLPEDSGQRFLGAAPVGGSALLPSCPQPSHVPSLEAPASPTVGCCPPEGLAAEGSPARGPSGRPQTDRGALPEGSPGSRNSLVQLPLAGGEVEGRGSFWAAGLGTVVWRDWVAG